MRIQRKPNYNAIFNVTIAVLGMAAIGLGSYTYGAITSPVIIRDETVHERQCDNVVARRNTYTNALDKVCEITLGQLPAEDSMTTTNNTDAVDTTTIISPSDRNRGVVGKFSDVLLPLQDAMDTVQPAIGGR